MSQVGTQPPANSSSNNKGLWGAVKKQGLKVGKRASVTTQKAKLRAEMMLVDNRIQNRKELFGVDLYDSLVIHAEQDPTFIIESETLDNIRGFFVTCFKDNKALLQKRALQQQRLVELDEQREVAYPKVPCETIGGQMKNGCKAANFARQETSCKAQKAMIEREMQVNKKKFGVDTYRLLCRLEDGDAKWLPSDRDVRFLYDQARRDIGELLVEKQQKIVSISLVGTANEKKELRTC